MVHILNKLVGFYHTECSQAELADRPERVQKTDKPG